MRKVIILLGMISYVNTALSQDISYNAIISQLIQIDGLDQLYRNQMEDVQKKYGGDSKELKMLFDNMRKTDSLNLVEVEAIIEKYG
jgi:hypothetical protein